MAEIVGVAVCSAGSTCRHTVKGRQCMGLSVCLNMSPRLGQDKAQGALQVQDRAKDLCRCKTGQKGFADARQGIKCSAGAKQLENQH